MTDVIKAYVLRNCENPLSQLRKTGLQMMAPVKDTLRQIATVGVEICICPRDNITDQYTVEQINQMIHKYLSRVREDGSGAQGAPRPPPSLLVGEYSKQHRWHYHGAILCRQIETLNRIKRYFNNKLGRTRTAQISYVDSYVNYCFKSYEDDPQDMLKSWHIFTSNSYVSLIDLHVAECSHEGMIQNKCEHSDATKGGANQPFKEGLVSLPSKTVDIRGIKLLKHKSILDYI